MFSNVAPIRFIRARPFSIMALCNIAGDLCYLGFAFDAQGFVSVPKLAGACFTMIAHIFLLAFGDAQAKAIADERGVLPRAFFALREGAQGLTRLLPPVARKAIRAKPVGIAFAMLAMNGAGLLADAVQRLASSGPGRIAAFSQVALGFLIVIGTACFSAADFTRSQKTADRLTKLAPTVLSGASIAGGILALATLNPFLMAAIVVFALANFSGFFARIGKEKGQHLHS